LGNSSPEWQSGFEERKAAAVFKRIAPGAAKKSAIRGETALFLRVGLWTKEKGNKSAFTFVLLS
jgi:hypothetical protein